MDVFFILFCHGVEKNRFTTHSNGLEGLQQSHGWWPSPPSMVFYKICHSSGLLLPPYWNALLTQRILDIFCCVKWWKSSYYSLQWARWVAVVPWAIPYQPSMVCHNKSRSEITCPQRYVVFFFFNICKMLAYFNHQSKVIDFVKTHWATIGHHPWACWSPSSPLEWV